MPESLAAVDLVVAAATAAALAAALAAATLVVTAMMARGGEVAGAATTRRRGAGRWQPRGGSRGVRTRWAHTTAMVAVGRQSRRGTACRARRD